jgi:Ca2+-binding EF-hand superfamily protein
MKLFAATLLIGAISLPILAQDAQREQRRRGQALAQMDTDGDGRISRGEWKGATAGFDRIDSNSDGFLTRQEVAQAAREAGRGIRENLRNMDTDGDGQISRDEWKGNPAAFDRLDENQDGLITAQELRERAGRGRRQGPPRQ